MRAHTQRSYVTHIKSFTQSIYQSLSVSSSNTLFSCTGVRRTHTHIHTHPLRAGPVDTRRARVHQHECTGICIALDSVCRTACAPSLLHVSSPSSYAQKELAMHGETCASVGPSPRYRPATPSFCTIAKNVLSRLISRPPWTAWACVFR